MTESGNTEEELDKKGIHSFGERLFAARESQGLSIVDIAKAIHLSEDIVDALEHSDVDRLPQPTFVQGYLRAYAKHLGISAAPILEEYSRAVPHSLETKLHPRSLLPDEAHSGSPFVKSVSIVLMVLILVAAVYGLYSYYSKIVDSRNGAEDDSSLILPEYDASVEGEVTYPFGQDNGYAMNSQADEQAVTESLPRGGIPDEVPVENTAVVQIESQVENESELQSESEDIPDTSGTPISEQSSVIATQPVTLGDDSLELVAHEDSWTEVVDANDVALLYDLVKRERTVVLRGKAPFNIFLGNAPAMEVRVNGIKIDMTKYVRSNKIARFDVSTNDQQVVFH